MKTRLHLTAAVLLGTAWQAHAAFTAVDNFNARPLGNIGGQGTWITSDTTSNQVIVDPGNSINKVLTHNGAGDAAVALPAGTTIANNTTGTFFLRVRRNGTGNDNSFGLNDTGTAGPGTPGNFEPMAQVIGNDFRGRDGGAGSAVTTPTATLQTNQWYKVWIVADNTTDTWRFYVKSDTDTTFSAQTELVATAAPPWNFRNGTAAALVAAQFYGNSATGSLYFDDLYIDNTGSNLTDPTFISNPDADGDGLQDAWEVFYFGNTTAQSGTDGATNGDNDGLNNLAEQTLGTNPTLADTDGDGLNDGPEDSGSSNTYSPGTRTNPLVADTDGDGASDGQEASGVLNVAFANAPTDPNAADTDFDGWSDKTEFSYATNPNDSGSLPKVHELIGLNKRNGGFELINNGVVNTVKIGTGWDVVGNDVDNWKNWAPPGTTFTDTGVEPGGTVGMRGFVQNNSATYNMTNYQAKAGDVVRLTYNRMNGGTLTANFIFDGTDLSLGIIDIPASTAQSTADGLSKELVFKIPAGNLAVGRKIGVGFKNTAGAQWPGLDNVVLTVVDADSDADGLSDFWEEQYFGNNDDNPQGGELVVATGNGAGGGSTDNDGDSFSNLDEQTAGSLPNSAASTPDDTDADGLADMWELTYFGTLTAQNGSGDPDGDFNSNEDEETASTDPNNSINWPDTDADTLNDGWEKTYFSNSLAQTATGNPDNDGFDNHAEMVAGSDPNDAAWSPSVPKLAHRWSFNGSLNDSVGTSHATIQNDTPGSLGLSNTLSATDLTLAGGTKATSDWAKLGANLLSGKKTPVTIELWATQNAVQTWSRIFDFHSSTTESLFMSWTQGVTAAQDRVQWVDATTSTVDNTNAPYALGTKYHIVMTIVPAVNSGGLLTGGSTVTWYSKNASPGNLMGPAKGSFTTFNTMTNFNDVINALGRSPFADNIASATYDEVRVWDGSMPAAARQTLQAAGPNDTSLLDTDGDGLYDSWETAYFTVITAQNGTGNPDGDSADNTAEQEAGSNPTVAASVPGDVDGDTLSDSWELLYFANLDQLPNGDPDGDYDTNSVEEDNLTIPNSKASFFSSTADTVSDSWKAFYGISSQTGADDLDEGTGDTLSNTIEFGYNTNPTDKDTDNDGLEDGAEITAGANPLVADTDGDGLLDGAEVNIHSSSPILVDTDGDAFSDKYEVDHGTLPNNAASFPTQPAGFTKVEDFEGPGMTIGQTFNGVNGWASTEAPKTTVIADPLRSGNKAGQWLNGTLSKSLTPAALAILQGNTGTVFFQLYQATTVTDHSLGVSDLGAPLNFVDFEAQFATIGGTLRVRDGAVATDTTYQTRVSQWMNVWMVCNNSSDTVKVYVESPLSQTGVVEITSALGPFDFRNGVAANALVSLLFVENITADTQILMDNIYVDPVAQNLTNPAAAPDADSDGMDDAWELTYGLSVGTNDSAGDLDNDGTSNLTEYRLGLIPNSGSSRFAVGTTLAAPGSFTLTWPSKTGVTFKIERSTSLAAGSWTPLQAAYPGTAGTTTYQDLTAPGGNAFYKVTLNP